MSLQRFEEGVHIGHLVLCLPMGGTEGLVDKMMRNPPVGFRASAICLDEIGILGEEAIRDGYQVELIPRGLGLNWKIPFAISQYVRRRAIDILHCHHYTPWFYGVLARMLHPRLKVIFTEHGRLYPDSPSAKKRFFNYIMYPFTSCLTAVSPAVAKALSHVDGFPLERIRIVFNGVDGSRFANLPDRPAIREKLGLQKDFLYFILCCRLDPIKWIDGLLRALRRVVDANARTGLLLVGEGREKEAIKRQIGELGLQDNVRMPGYRTDIPEWLASSDIFVLSSLSEGTSVSLIESMAAGIPAVATRVGGNEYVIEDGVTGLLVEPQDVASLASGMLCLAGDGSLREEMGRKARAQFSKRFELARMFESYEEIYRSVCAQSE